MKRIKTAFISGILFFFSQMQVSAQNNSIMQENTTIFIADKPQKSYPLELKNGKPFQGFEVLEKAIYRVSYGAHLRYDCSNPLRTERISYRF